MKDKSIRNIVMIVGIVAAVSIFVYFRGNAEKKNTSNVEPKTSVSKVDKIKEAGKLIVYTNAEFAPYEYIENNEIVGVDVEIAEKIAAKLEVELEVVNTSFEGLIAAGAGKGDLILAGLAITPEREKEIDFSVPYVISYQYLLLKEDSDIASMEDLAGKVSGGQTGTTGVILTEEEIRNGMLKDTGASFKHYASAPLALADLQAGRLDAIIVDELPAKLLAKENEGFKAVPFVYKGGKPVSENFAAATAKGNEDLLKIVNEVLEEMIANNEIEALIEKYKLD